MSPKRLLVLTAIVAVLFAFIAFFERKLPTTADRERKGELYWDIPEDRLERLELTRGGEVLEFQKSETAPWRMVKPDPYPADTFAVGSVVSELAELKRAGGDSNDGRPSDYGLDKPTLKATLVWTDPADPKIKKTQTLEFGVEIPGTDIVAARLEGTTKVLFVPVSVLTAVKKSADDFRSRDLFAGPSVDVTRLEIMRGRGHLVLARKDGAWWLAEPFADLAAASEADRLVGQLTALRVTDFVHTPEDLAALGLNPPLYRVTVTGAKGAVTAVDFGATRADGNTVYARREGQVLTLEREIVDELSKEAVAFRSPELVAFNRSEVTGVEGRFEKGSFVLAQKEGGWTSGSHPILAAAADDVLTAILGVKSKSFLEEGETKTLPDPVATVTIRLKAGPPWTVSFTRRGADAVARVSSRPGGFLLDREVPEKLSAAFQKAAVAPTPAATKTSKP